jgi:serine/threonine protein kinase
MAAATSADLLEHLRRYRLLEPTHLEAVERTLVSQFPDPRMLAKELLERGWLSSYQVNQLFSGRGKNLVLGSYVLIERLGGGGMGEVFKARNWKLGKTVALKVVRKERIADKGAVQRFQREIRAAAQLTHPNIVRAYDADQVGGTHLLVMEYVAGTDLSKLVKAHGPLPMDQACDFIRQAAAGLQHAFERGMVHRDIKPHNLLLSVAGGPSSGAPGRGDRGQIKILDMGLARLAQAHDDGQSSSAMTQEGAIMGTPDYIAPEQARESHTVDIRADLYSLGCTFFYLLTGSVPFPKGSLIQKLARHQFDEPPAVEALRPEVAPPIAAIVRKLMAKLPQERYQTPAELIDALAMDNLFPSAAQPGQESVAGTAALPPTATLPADDNARDGDTAALWSSVVTPPIRVAPKQVGGSAVVAASRAKLWIVAGGGVSLALASFLLWQTWGQGQARVQEGDLAKGSVPLAKTQPKVIDSAMHNPVTPTGPDQNKEPPNKEVQGKEPEGKEPAKIFFESDPALEAWCKTVAAMMPEEQEKTVAKEIKNRNPGFDGLVTSQIFKGVITSLEFHSDKVNDLAPIRALPALKRLTCAGSGPGKGRLADLAPLHGLALVYLNADYTKVADLSPLRGMPLEFLYLAGSPAADLTPLKGLFLKELRWDFSAERDTEILRSFPTLRQINGQPAAKLLKKASAKK